MCRGVSRHLTGQELRFWGTVAGESLQGCSHRQRSVPHQRSGRLQRWRSVHRPLCAVHLTKTETISLAAESPMPSAQAAVLTRSLDRWSGCNSSFPVRDSRQQTSDVVSTSPLPSRQQRIKHLG